MERLRGAQPKFNIVLSGRTLLRDLDGLDEPFEFLLLLLFADDGIAASHHRQLTISIG